MKRKLASGIVAGVAALATTAGGVTYAAFSDFGDVPGNTVGAGILRLQLDDAGSGQLPISFDNMAPDGPIRKALWLVSSADDSTPPANLSLTVKNVSDVAADCSASLGKAMAENEVAANACTITKNKVTPGAPANGGLLSQVLIVKAGYYPGVTTSAGCASAAAAADPSSWFWNSGGTAGDLHTIPSAGSSFTIGTPPVTLQPGDGACIAISAQWPMNHTGPTDLDDAAQGDSVSFDVRVDLVQQ